uniref:BSD domain-containing protein n=1 Tax=Leersia perrieri TaxID=77586 RepID=A0A0D9WMG5_9ORYZ
MARGFRGVRDDLTELGRHILDIACFLHPLLAPAHIVDSPPATPTSRHHHHHRRRSPSPRPSTPPSPSILAGILADLAEIGGSFTRRAAPLPDPTSFSAAAAAAAAAEEESPQPASSTASSPPAPAAAAVDGLADDVVGAAQALAARPEAWIDFPVLALDENSVISNIQRDHMEAIEKLVPDLASLRARLCPSYMDDDIFWKIYFTLLEYATVLLISVNHLYLQEDDNVRGSVHQVNEIESDSSPNVCEIESEKSTGYRSPDDRALKKTRSDQSIDQWVFAKSKSEQSMDQWSEIPSDVESSRDGRRYISGEELSDADSAHVVVMDKYMDSLLSDRRSIPYASSSVRRDSVRRKPASSTDYSHRPPQPTPPASLSKKESWDVIEDSEFEILDS